MRCKKFNHFEKFYLILYIIDCKFHFFKRTLNLLYIKFKNKEETMEHRTWKAAWIDYLEPDLKFEEEALTKENIELNAYQLRNASVEEALKHLADKDMLVVNMFPCTRNFLDSLKECKMLIRHGSGYDNVKVQDCTDNGIVFVHIPDANTFAVAEHAVTLLMATARKIRLFDSIMRESGWDWKSAQPLYQVSGKTLGVVGCGRIGSHFIHLMKGFDMRVLVYDPYIPKEKTENELGIKIVNFETLLKESDHISIHAPRTEETYHLFGEAQFRLMKKTAYIINTSRGPLIEEKALVKALQEGWIAGAGIDVYEKEPPKESKELLSIPNAVFSGHVAWYTEEATWKMRHRIVEDLIAFNKGVRPQYVLNPEVWDKKYGKK